MGKIYYTLIFSYCTVHDYKTYYSLTNWDSKITNVGTK